MLFFFLDQFVTYQGVLEISPMF